jgi:hypothetical protein
MNKRLGVVLAVYLVHLALALAFAWPATRLVADATLAHPRGDLVLFEPGATYLIEAFRLQRAALSSVAEGSVFALLATAYIGLLPLAALIHALARSGRVTFASLLAAGARFFNTFSLLLGLALLATAFVVAVPLTAGGLIGDKIKLVMGDKNRDFAHAVFYVLALVFAAVVAVVHDLARSAVVAHDLSALRAILFATQTFRAAPWRAMGGWAMRGAAGLLLVLFVALIATRIGVVTGPRFLAVTILHQAAAFALVFLRSRWLASALALVTR